MLYVFFVVTGLFFCSMIKSMNTCSSDYLPLACLGGYDTEIIHYNKDVVVKQPSKEKIKKYAMQGIHTITIDGASCQEVAQWGRMKVEITQIPEDSLEQLVICAEKDIFRRIIKNKNISCLEIGLHRSDEPVCSCKDIVMRLKLKNLVKIVTNNCVDTIFLSPIRSEKLHISVALGATMQLPFIRAKTIELLVKENSSLIAQDDARLKAKDLLFIYREGSSKIELGVKTKLLQAQSNGKGAIILKGVATEQELRFLEGSLFAMGLQSKEVRMEVVAGVGEVELCADSVKGVMSVKSNYDITYCAPSKDSLCIYPAEEL